MTTTTIIKHFGLASLIIFPAFILVNQYLPGLSFILAMLLGCRYFFAGTGGAINTVRDEKIFFISVSLLTVTAAVSAVVNGFDFERLDRLSILVLAIPVYYFYRNNPPREGLLWFGLVCGAVVAGVTALYQVLGSSTYARAGGITNPIMFGDIALVMGFMSMAGSGWFVKQYRWGVIFPVLGFTFGIMASALSLARGGWIALPVVIAVFAWFSVKHISTAKLLSILVLVIVGISVIYHTPQFKVKDRVELTVSNFNNYLKSESTDDPVRVTGLGIRLDMWKTSWNIFQEDPILGVGWGSYRSRAEKYVAEGFVIENVAFFPHPHNQYLSALAKGGLFGLLAVLLTFAVPLFLFYRLLVSDRESNELKRFALAGVVFLLSFMVFGLTEAVFERSRIMTFFAFYLVVLMALMNSSRNSNP